MLASSAGVSRLHRAARAITIVITGTVLAACPQPFEVDVVDVLQDTNGPRLVLTSPENDDLFRDAIVLTGTAIDLDSDGNERALNDAAAIPAVSWSVPAMDVEGQATVGADGSFEVVIDSSGFDRNVTIILTATDENGNESTVQVRALYDSRGPDVVLTSPAADSVYGKTVSVSGVVSTTDTPGDTTGVASLSYEVSNSSISDVVTFSETTGEFTFAFDTDGIGSDIVIRVIATDNQGDTTTVILPLSQDALGPAVTISSPASYSTYASTVTVSGSVANGVDDPGLDEVASVAYTALAGAQSGTLDLSPGGSFSFTVDTTGVSADVVVTVTASDIHGFDSSASIILLNDRIGPYVTITTPEQGYYGPLVELSGSVRNTQMDFSLSEVDVGSVAWRVPGTALSGALVLDGSGGFSAQIDATSLTTNIVLEVVASDVNLNQSVAQVSLLKPTGGGDINVTAQADNGAIVLSWNDVTGASSYRIEESVFGGIRDNVSLDGNGEYRWSGLRNGTFHEFQVIATVPGYPDAVSAPVIVAPMSDRTFQPRVASGAFGRLEVTWPASLTSGARYLVERRVDGGGWESVRVTGSAGYVDADVAKDSVYEYRVTLRSNGSSSDNTSRASRGARIRHFPNAPTFSLRENPNEAYVDLERSGDHLFATTQGEDFVVFDITNPARPREIARVTDVGRQFHVSGTVAYVMDSSTVTPVDVTTPASPSLGTPASYDSPSSIRGYRLRSNGSLLFAVAEPTSGDSTINVFDINGANAMAPSLVDTFTVAGVVRDVELVSGYLYISMTESGGDEEIAFADIDPPPGDWSSLSLTGMGIEANLGGSGETREVRRMTLNGTDLYVQQRDRTFLIIDVSSPGSPSYVAKTGTLTYGTGDLVVDSGRSEVYVADSYSKAVRVFDVSDPFNIPPPSTVDADHSVLDVAFSGQYIYGAENNSSNGAIAVLDRSYPTDPGTPVTVDLTSTGSTSNGVESVAVSGDTIYAVGRQGDFWIVDMSDPGAPVELSATRPLGNARDVAAAGDTVFVAANASGVGIIDASNPMSPVPLLTYGQIADGRTNAIAVSGEYVYVDNVFQDSLAVASAAAPGNLVLVAEETGGGQGGIALDGSYAYTISISDKLMYGYDVTNPESPALVDSRTVSNGGGQAYDIATSNGRGYVYTSGDVVILDLATNRSAITEIGTIPITSQAFGGQAIAADGNIVLVGSNSTVEVWDVEDASAPSLVSTIPVNARSIAISGGYAVIGHRGELKVSIVDLDGFNR